MSISLNTTGAFNFNTKARVSSSTLQNVALLKGRLPQVPSLTQSVTQGRGAQTTIVATQLPRVTNEPALVPTFSNLRPRVEGGGVERPIASNQLPRVTDEPALVPILSNVRPRNDGDIVDRSVARITPLPDTQEVAIGRIVKQVPAKNPADALTAAGTGGVEDRFKPIGYLPPGVGVVGKGEPRQLPRELDVPIARASLPAQLGPSGIIVNSVPTLKFQAASPIEREPMVYYPARTSGGAEARSVNSLTPQQPTDITA
jgi:hypothetical protein